MFVTLSEGKKTNCTCARWRHIKDKVEKTNITVNRTRVTKTNEHPMASTVQAILGILLAAGCVDPVSVEFADCQHLSACSTSIYAISA